MGEVGREYHEGQKQLSFQVGDASLGFLFTSLGSVRMYTWAARIHVSKSWSSRI